MTPESTVSGRDLHSLVQKCAHPTLGSLYLCDGFILENRTRPAVAGPVFPWGTAIAPACWCGPTSPSLTVPLLGHLPEQVSASSGQGS